ncbi:ladinin-1-like isoform X2 [Pristis pectinata]|uniref:ladinin-1-like isoform X2 n=1 Tax=Pristis pectinata TaxID=685728 RepID=UPI00223C9C97|nr:ladinin-1-like isoform X2 [Pristis pectinata]
MRKTFKLKLKSDCNGTVEGKTLPELHTTGEFYCISTSLARQRSMEDDEEFEKARRRRTRMNSSLTDNEGIPEEQHTSENSTAFNEQEVTSPHSEDESVPFAEMLKRREEDKRRYQRETLQSLKIAKFGSESEFEGESKNEQGNENKKPEMKEVPNKTPRKQTEDNYSTRPIASTLKEKETNNRAASTQNHSELGNTGHQPPLSPVHTTRAFISLGKPKVKSPTKLKRQPSLENNEHSREENSSMKIENDCHKSQSKATGVKGKERGGYEKLQEDAFKQESKNNARVQDEKCGVQQEKKENIPDHSSSNNSPFRRFSPRATSFRATNPEGKSQPFQRSASLRIPARSSSGKIDGILEKYAKAIERSDSIKSKPSLSDYLSRPLEGVASKRCVFEKEDAQNGSSRFLMTRKDIRPGDVASKRNLWENKADSVEKKKLQDHHSFRKSYDQRVTHQNESVNFTDRESS